MSTFTPLVAGHAVCATTVLLLGPVALLRRRRDRAHRIVGGVWFIAMVATCATSFLIHPHGFSWLHALSVFTLGSVTVGLRAALRGDARTHRANMIGSYLGTVIAFAFAAAVPGRAIPSQLGTDPVPLVLATTTLGAALMSGAVVVVRRHGTRPSPRIDRPQTPNALGPEVDHGLGAAHR